MNMDVIIELAEEALTLPDGLGLDFFDSVPTIRQECWAPYLKFLYLVVKTFRPKVAVECGVNRGTSLAHMAAGNKGTVVIGIDRELQPEISQVMGRFCNTLFVMGDSTTRCTFDKVRMICNNGDSGGNKIGLLFLDSTHDGITPMQEFKLYRPLFADRCFVVVDDLLGPKHLEKLMREFWDWLPGTKIVLHELHPVPATHAGVIDEPGFGVALIESK